MKFPANPTLRQQLPFVAQLISDETRLESERRGQIVPTDDPVVRANVCAAIVRIMSGRNVSSLGRIAAEIATATPVRSITAPRAA
jgi:hypothetical protein